MVVISPSLSVSTEMLPSLAYAVNSNLSSNLDLWACYAAAGTRVWHTAR
jgi:hypothetical protein